VTGPPHHGHVWQIYILVNEVRGGLMERMLVDGVELEYQSMGAGTGPPVLLIHGSHVAEAMQPLAEEPALADRYQLIRYHRRGFAGSTHAEGPVSLGRQAADAAGVIEQLGVAPAHIAGHSYGGATALQLGVDRPDVVRSLALLEPALLAVPSTQAMLPELVALGERYATGDAAGAVGQFLELISGRSNWREVLDARLPGAYDQAVKDARTFFEIEMPAIQEWAFGAGDAARIDKPVLSVLGAESLPFFGEGRGLLQSWFPRAELYDLPGAGHFLQMENSAALAGALGDFFARH
jgi:pimeloyl-ACP methyl ester carboxylesterase